MRREKGGREKGVRGERCQVPFPGLFHEVEKILIMPVMPEERGTKIRPVQRMIDHPARIHSPHPAHDPILSVRSSKEKVPDTFFTPVALAKAKWLQVDHRQKNPRSELH